MPLCGDSLRLLADRCPISPVPVHGNAAIPALRASLPQCLAAFVPYCLGPAASVPSCLPHAPCPLCLLPLVAQGLLFQFPVSCLLSPGAIALTPPRPDADSSEPGAPATGQDPALALGVRLAIPPDRSRCTLRPSARHVIRVGTWGRSSTCQKAGCRFRAQNRRRDGKASGYV